MFFDVGYSNAFLRILNMQNSVGHQKSYDIVSVLIWVTLLLQIATGRYR